MQDEVQRIQGQFRRAYHGPAWHGPSFKEALQGVTAALAASHPLDAAHSIWEITLHVTVWHDVARRRLGGEFVEPTPDEDWPEVEEDGEAVWTAAIRRLEDSFDQLDEAIGKVQDEELADFVPGCNYNVHFLLMGVVQHSAYHGGQISLLRRAAG